MKLLSFLIALSLLALSPGLPFYEAAGATFRQTEGREEGRLPGSPAVQATPSANEIRELQDVPQDNAAGDDGSVGIEAADPTLEISQASNGSTAVRRSEAELGRIDRQISADLGSAANADAAPEASSGLADRIFAALSGARESERGGTLAATAPGTLVSAAAAPLVGAQRLAAPAASVQAPAAGPASPGVSSAGNSGGSDDGSYSPRQVQRAIWGMTAGRVFDLAALSIGMVAYPLLVIQSVGTPWFLTLSTLGSLASIPFSILAGKLGDLLPLKSYMLFNIGLRVAISVSQGIFWKLGWLGVGPLFTLTLLSSWQFATLFSGSDALQTEVVGSDVQKLRKTESKIRMATIFVTVFSGLLLSGALVQNLGFFWVFVLSGAIQAVVIPILWWTLPGGGRMSRAAAPLWATFKQTLAKWRDGFSSVGKSGVHADLPWKRWGIDALALAGAGALFFVPIPGAPWMFHSSIPFVIVAGTMVWRMKIFQTVIRPNKLMLLCLAFIMIGAFIEVPLRNSALGVLATEITKGPGAAALLGSLIASFYLGQLPSGTGMLDPNEKIFGRIGFKQVMKWAGALTVGLCSYFVLLPKGFAAAALAYLGLGSWAAALPAWAMSGAMMAAVVVPAMAIYFALHYVSGRVTDAQWMRVEAGSLFFISLPLLFWGQLWALYLSLATFGFALNGSQRMVSAAFKSEAKKEDGAQFQLIMGVRQAFSTMTYSVAFAVQAFSKQIATYLGYAHAYPFTWYVIAGIYAVFGILFIMGSGLFNKSKPAQNPRRS